MVIEDIVIRVAKIEDAERLVEIYAPYVKNTAITFEYEVPSVEEFRGRIEGVLMKYPYIVAELKGKIVGYAYIGAFVGRAAYDWSVETSIYLDQAVRRCGIGRKLYIAIENILKEMNILNLNACIGYSEVEDEYLTKSSVKFHNHLGYKWVGEFHKCGYKFDRWYDMVWMEKIIGNHVSSPPKVLNFNDVKQVIAGKYDIR